MQISVMEFFCIILSILPLLTYFFYSFIHSLFYLSIYLLLLTHLLQNIFLMLALQAQTKLSPNDRLFNLILQVISSVFFFQHSMIPVKDVGIELIPFNPSYHIITYKIYPNKLEQCL